MKPFIPEDLPIETFDHSSPETIKAMGEANRSLARYDAFIERSPSPQLFLTPLTSREAMLSSRIEGSQSTLNEVLRFEADEGFAAKGEQRDDLNEIKNYISALRLAEGRLRERSFSLGFIRELHATLLGMGSVRGQKKNPGGFRTKQNWIGIPGMSVEQATFVPPEPVFVQEFMEKWEKFYHSDQPDILVQAAMLHAQFELIHPFEDGNGRLGRLVIPLFFCEKKAISRPNFYLSAYLEKNRDAYMNALKGLNSKPGKWNDWILFFLKAVDTQAREDSAKVREMTTLYEDMKTRFVDITRSQFAVPVLDAVFERPVFSRKGVEKNLKTLGNPPSVPTLVNLLNKLVNEKVLEVVTEGKGRRGTVYALAELIELLESSE